MILGSLATVLFVTSSVSGLPSRYEDLSRRSADMSASSASSGCGSTTAWQFDADNHSNVTMEDRSFLVHIPAAYNANTPHAVVLSFHGFQEDDLNQEMISGLSEKGLKLNGKVRADH
jgi:poly(3-hydroxybutyrate) depolymerase